MMEEQKTIFDYIGRMFSVYGIIIAIFMILGMIVGEPASSYSALFSLGQAGLSFSTLLQLLGFAAMISLFQLLFLTDALIKKCPMAIRMLCFFAAIILVIVALAVCFSWFPINDKNAWFGFLVSFGMCTAISVGISSLKEKAENKKMEQALKRLRKKE